MKLVKPSFEILHMDADALKRIEDAGRTCYKSEDKMTDDSAIKFTKSLITRGHVSVIEHANATVKFIIDIGISHELVRHRLCAFSQESSRYCRYNNCVTFIIPPWCNFEPGEYPYYDCGSRSTQAEIDWYHAMIDSEEVYHRLLKNGWAPQQARSVLPKSLKTEIVVTTNMREWRHIFQLRTSKAAHPQMQEIMKPLLSEFNNRIPVLFEDIINYDS